MEQKGIQEVEEKEKLHIIKKENLEKIFGKREWEDTLIIEDLADEEDVEELFSKYGLVNLTFDYYRPQYEKQATEVTVEFDSTSYDGKLSKSVEDLFELVCNRFGFSSYNYSYGDYRVTFEV